MPPPAWIVALKQLSVEATAVPLLTYNQLLGVISRLLNVTDPPKVMIPIAPLRRVRLSVVEVLIGDGVSGLFPASRMTCGTCPLSLTVITPAPPQLAPAPP